VVKFFSCGHFADISGGLFGVGLVTVPVLAIFIRLLNRGYLSVVGSVLRSVSVLV